ncbi:MAG: ATP-binding cassette protein [Flavipsychrobacter sp.]|nr:ATP-binding cassette protein [Flavipsychrobacter sp.]
MIAATHLSKQYGKVQAVNDISFEVKEGENLVLLGTSGCGKTTTLKMLNRIIAPTAGTVSINGTDVMQQNPETLRRSIGYVLQHNSLFPHYTIAENIAVVPHLLRWDKQKIKLRTKELINKLHLPKTLLDKYPHELSGGQQQRVNIARALAADPPVLLMDEPFGALDTITRSSIVKEFSELDEFKRKTIVMVTHDVQEAFHLGDRICLMSEGRIVQQGTPVELLFHPANDFVKEFFAGSYLRLALSAVTVNAIWDKLQDGNTVTDAMKMNGDDSLWSVLEYMVKNKDTRSVVVKNKEGQTKQVSKQEIFKALSEL